MTYDSSKSISAKTGLLALSPIVVFTISYLTTSLIIGDFYKMPLSVAFIASAIWGVAITKGLSLTERINIFSKGAANHNVLYMVWIFILAGAFSSLAKGMGAIDATVQLTLSVIPSAYLVAGIFIAACFISVSIGTSVGTIVALTPFAVEVSNVTGIDVAYIVSAVISGSFFGDNLSFISDTTIAATRSQNCAMNEKFKANIWIAMPAAIATLCIYIISAPSCNIVSPETTTNYLLVVPYFLVIITAICGLNVLLVLTIGIVSSLLIAIITGGMDFIDLCSYMGEGIDGMGNLIVVTMLAAGMLQIIQHNKGIDYIIQCLTSKISGKRAAYFSISALVSLVNICTANNTIAIITTGEISQHISKRFNLVPRKVASILDTSSCIVQSIIPYGAQILLAAGIAEVTPISFLPHIYYTYFLAAMVVITVLVIPSFRANHEINQG